MAYLGTKPNVATSLADNSISSSAIQDGAVGTNDIADGAVTSAKIADGTIVNADISNTAAIATSKISGLATVATSGSASDLSTGTLPAARLPTSGVTAGSYTSSNITVDATGRITAASSGSSGGVSSLNGQTGAITNTTFNVIGSYTAGVGANGGTYAVGSTIAGSSIRQNLNDQQNAFQNVQTNAGSNGNQGQSGTWRAMTRGASYSGGEGEWYLGSVLWVRIS